MPGDVGAVASFFETILDVLFDPNKWERMSRDLKLKTIREGLNAAIDANDWAAADRWMAAYRRMSEQTGP